MKSRIKFKGSFSNRYFFLNNQQYQFFEMKHSNFEKRILDYKKKLLQNTYVL